MTLELRTIEDFSSIEARQWDRLDHADNPFVSHAFLSALESSGSVNPGSGWAPQHLAIFENGQLAACAPTYLKGHSHGEFVFDWSWADAYQRLGRPYYPKLLTAVPYTPVSGPRLLTRRDHKDPASLRRQLVAMALDACEQRQLSSWHCNFVVGDDRQALAEERLLHRHDWQFHWHNKGYADFEDFLAQLRSRKRKNIRRERNQVREAGIEFRWVAGQDVTSAEIDFLYRCYVGTFRQYGNHPALTREFFETIARALGERFLLIVALRRAQPVAMSLFLAGGGRLYGRYWGCNEDIPGLHFETAYYQGIEFCIQHDLDVFESGAQGEHKVSRGFLPRGTRSFHYLQDVRFREVIAAYLERERAWMDQYREQLEPHGPYRAPAA